MPPLFSQTYVPTVFENYTACLETEEQRVELSLWDTSGKTMVPKARFLSPLVSCTAVFLKLFPLW